jgi:hypothetical protein
MLPRGEAEGRAKKILESVLRGGDETSFKTFPSAARSTNEGMLDYELSVRRDEVFCSYHYSYACTDN